MTHFLEVAVALIFFANKVFVLIGKKAGWLLGAIAALLGAIYFFRVDLDVFVVLEIGLIVLMGYAFVAKEKNPKMEKVINTVIAVVMVTLTVFVFKGMMTILEFLASTGLLIGTYYLTHEKERLGWALYVIAHSLAAIVGYGAKQSFFADFQIASAIVSVAGVVKENSKK